MQYTLRVENAHVITKTKKSRPERTQMLLREQKAMEV